MGSTLEHGIYLPSEGEKNCYSGLANNWQAVDTNIGYVTALRQAIAGALTRQIVTQLPTEDIDPNCIYMILKATAQTSNIYDEYMYINSNWELIGDSQLDLSNYYTKQEVNQLPAVASGVTSTKVGNYDTHIADTNIHVTVADKSKWDTVALIKQLRLVNAQVGSATTIPFSDFDDTNGIKVGDKCADLDVKVFEITAVDTANQTVTVTPLIDIALDANVVHTNGNETIGGFKTFDRYIQCNGGYIGTEASTNARTELVLRSNRDTAGQSGLLFTKFRQNVAQGSMTGNDVVYLTLDLLENSVRTNAIFRFNFRDFVNDIPQDIAFYPTGAKNSLGGSASGSSNNKWHLINGIEPSALGMPDLANAVDISGYITNFGAGTANEYTPVSNGWISISSSGDSPVFIRVYNDYGFEQVAYSERNEVGGTSGGTYSRFGSLIIPCVKNVKLYIIVSPSTSVLVSAKFFPCQGNV